MAEVINLNRARKAKARLDKTARAEVNRAKHGRSKGEKQLNDAETERARRSLDQSRRDP